MNKDFSQAPRPTFKRALRRISMISVVISMTLVWLLLCTASIFTLKQYAQKNLELTAATMGRSLEAALVFGDSAAAEDTLATMAGKDPSPHGITMVWSVRIKSATSSANGSSRNPRCKLSCTREKLSVNSV